MTRRLSKLKETITVSQPWIWTMVVKAMRFLIVVLFVLAVEPQSLAQGKDDVVVMKNGDRFTGEIKGLSRGELSFKAKYMVDSVRLDWKEVARLESQNSFIVSLANGSRFAGRIEEINGRISEEIGIIAGETKLRTSPSEVVLIQPRKGSFRDQLDGSISYGFTFTGDNNQASSALSANVGYNGSRNAVQLSSSSQLNAQSKGVNTSRFTFNGEYLRKLTQNWFYDGLIDLLKSDQQKLDLRNTYGGGIGRHLLQTDQSSILVFGGVVYTHESYASQPGIESIRNNAESLIGVRATTFRFGKMDLNSQLLIYPGLSDAGRVRLSTQTNANIEFIKNFFANFSLYENFDSRPPVEAPRNDVGVTTGLGWKF
jgi:hypothetical protein